MNGWDLVVFDDAGDEDIARCFGSDRNEEFTYEHRDVPDVPAGALVRRRRAAG